MLFLTSQPLLGCPAIAGLLWGLTHGSPPDQGIPLVGTMDAQQSAGLFQTTSRLIKDWKEILWDSSDSHLLARHPSSFEKQQPCPGSSRLVGNPCQWVELPSRSRGNPPSFPITSVGTTVASLAPACWQA